MTKAFFTFLLSFISVALTSQQITGIIYYQNSGGKTAEGIQVSAFGCDATYTVSNGTFILPCPRKSIGQKIKLIIGNTDAKGRSIEVVNNKQLELLTIPDESETAPVEIIICYAGQRDEAALRYYGILTKPTTKKYELQVKEIEAQLEKNTLSADERKTLIGQIEELKSERNAALEKLEEQAQLLANINQDTANELVKSAIKKIEEGKEIEAALASIFEKPEPDIVDPLKTFESKLAQVLNRPEDLIELNLPPVDGRYPGTVLLSPQSGQTLAMRRAFRPEELPNVFSDISINLNGRTQSNMISNLLGNMGSFENLSVQIDLKDLRLFEIDLSSKLKKSLLRNKSIYRAEKRGLNPRTIVRAYEAMLTYTIQKSTSFEREAWEKIRTAAIDVGGRLTSNGGIMIESNQPSVIAYESVLVNYIVNNLDAGNPDEVILKDYLVNQSAADNLSPNDFGLSSGDKKVSYYSMGNALYENENFGNLNVVEQSTQLFGQTMKQVGATPLMDTPIPQTITSNKMKEVLNNISTQLRKQKSKSLFVFYYVGHAISGPNGHLYLVLKDYNGNPNEDIGENYLYGLSREQLENPSSPVSGSNFSDLFDVVNALQTEYPEQIDGLFPVSEIEKHFRDTKTPFVILVDACYSVEQMDQLREQLSLTENGDYYGPTMFGGAEQVNRYADAIQRFGNVPYLNSDNVVLLSSAPGSIAVVVPDPKPALLKPKYVAPLARRIYDRYESALLTGESISYGDFFYSIVDVKELGEVKIQGTTSWSDFSVLNKIKMLKEK